MDLTPVLKDGIALYHEFIALHKSQLEASEVPRHFWEELYRKLKYQIFNAGESFSLLKVDYEGTRQDQDPIWKVIVSSEKGIKKCESSHIYLIDHAWTYRINTAKHDLRQMSGLLNRMLALMDVPHTSDVSTASEELIEKVYSEMWKYNQTYTIGPISNVEERLPVWYIMDEFGSAIPHSDTPTFRVIPFIHLPQGLTYSILFPIQDVMHGNEVSRDYVEGRIQNSLTREVLLLPWRWTDFTKHAYRHTEPDSDYFLEGHIAETLPDNDILNEYHFQVKPMLKVFSEYSFINMYLTHPRFEIVQSEDDADILWYTTHFKDFRNLSVRYPWKFINQFPFEHVITVKDLLSIVCQNQNITHNEPTDFLDSFPVWFPTTYNLKTEILQFASYYQHRKKLDLDNHWICKPFNLARGLDTHITNNLNCIVKLSLTGPKIAQKYIEQPVLFKRSEIGSVKFDIRYIIVLKSVKPLNVYVYKNFFLRFANLPFDLEELDNYEKHFTVMNYSENANLCHKLCNEFIAEFEAQYTFKWKEIEENIFKMIHSVFIAATSKPPPAGIAHNQQSRAVYAMDLMLSWKKNNEMQPKLLEVNWCPDCQRACEYYPNFYNDIFGLLFLNEENPELFKLL